MVDKIGIALPEGGAWSTGISAFLDTGTTLKSGWSGSTKTYTTPQAGVRDTVVLTHSDTGLTVVGNKMSPQRLTYSPARMLRPTNTILPASDEELAASWTRAQGITSEVCELPAQRGHLTRLDATLYVQEDTNRIIQLFDRVRAPGFRRATYPERYESGLRWRGSKKSLLLYSKALEQGEGQTDDRTRVELQLHGTTIANTLGFGAGGKVYSVGVCEAYAALRRYLLTFPVSSIAPDYNQDVLVAHATTKGVRAPDGRSLMDWRLDDIKDSAHRTKTRRRIQGMVLTCSEFRWADLLPESPTPEEWRRLCGYRD